MAKTNRRMALLCMTPVTDAGEAENMDMPSYGVKRILAAVASDPELDGAEFAMIDFRAADVDAYVDAILSFEADLVGISVYIWSSLFMMEVARRVKQVRPECVIVFGGPSARKELFDLPPYGDPSSYLDAIVSSEGEIVFQQIARLDQLDRAGLQSIGGLDLPTDHGWERTGPRTPIANLDSIASPFQLGLMPTRSVAYLETYRGCPMSCAFCEWGMNDSSSTVFSTEYIARELTAFAQADVPAVFSVDAGLNLHARAFRNLRDAEREIGFFKSAGFWCEVYPSHVQEDQLEFLDSIGGSNYLGIGLQSLDNDVLKDLGRPFDRTRFERVVGQLAGMANCEIQIIFGLPGDSPAGFLRSLDYARSFPAAVRAYHCLVLPDALLTRAKPEWQLEFDHRSLEMQSCLGWTNAEIQSMRDFLTNEALACGGTAGQFWWHFPNQVHSDQATHGAYVS